MKVDTPTEPRSVYVASITLPIAGAAAVTFGAPLIVFFVALAGGFALAQFLYGTSLGQLLGSKADHYPSDSDLQIVAFTSAIYVVLAFVSESPIAYADAGIKLG